MKTEGVTKYFLATNIFPTTTCSVKASPTVHSNHMKRRRCRWTSVQVKLQLPCPHNGRCCRPATTLVTTSIGSQHNTQYLLVEFKIYGILCVLKINLFIKTSFSPLVRSDKYFVSFSTCNPTACSHWLTQSQKEADIYYLFIIG